MANQAVIDAWADMKPWVEGTLPTMANGVALPDLSSSVGDIGACNALNSPGGESGGAVWGSDGAAVVNLTALKLAALSGVAIQAANFVDANTVQLPFGFTLIQAQGNYNYSQPCAMYDFGKKAMSSSASGKGTVTQTIKNSNLCYVARFDNKLTLTGVTVNGSLDVSVNPDTDGLPGWLVAIGNFFSTFNESNALRGTIQDVFLNASFTQTMISLLNQKLGGK